MSEREFRRGVIADDGVHWRLASMKKIRPQAWIVTSSSFHENTHVITQPLFPSLHTQTVCSCYSNHVVHSETDRRCLGDWLQPIPDSAIFFDWDVVQPKVTVLERFAFPPIWLILPFQAFLFPRFLSYSPFCQSLFEVESKSDLLSLHLVFVEIVEDERENSRRVALAKMRGFFDTMGHSLPI